MATIHRIGIDVTTRTQKRLIRRLAALKTTIDVQDGGVYREDTSYSQVHLITTKTEAEVDDWLYKTKDDIDFVGTFELPSPFVDAA